MYGRLAETKKVAFKNEVIVMRGSAVSNFKEYCYFSQHLTCKGHYFVVTVTENLRALPSGFLEKVNVSKWHRNRKRANRKKHASASENLSTEDHIRKTFFFSRVPSRIDETFVSQEGKVGKFKPALSISTLSKIHCRNAMFQL